MSTKVVKLSKVPPVSFVSSGIAEVDEMVGGFPRGRVTQVYGLSSVGKTSLMLKCLSVISIDSRVLYVDVENALAVERAKEMGADLTKIDYSNESVLEEVCEIVRRNLDKYDCIVIDSVAMLVPRAEHDGEVGDAHVGLKPRLLGQWLRMIERDLAQTRTALVLINQMRRTMELYGEKYVLPGGMQLKFSSSLMLHLTTTAKDKIYKDKAVVGHWVHATVTKSKVGKPNLTTKFKITY